MGSSGYVEWYERQPKWVQLALLPVFLPVAFVHAAVVVTVVFGLVIPALAVWLSWKNSQSRRRLRRAGRVTSWPEVEPRVLSGAATLLVEVSPKGPGSAWLFDRPRAVVDPEGVVPCWGDYEVHDLALFDHRPDAVRLDRWMAERLRPYETTALMLTPSESLLAGLPAAAKRDSVLVVYGGWDRGWP